MRQPEPEIVNPAPPPEIPEDGDDHGLEGRLLGPFQPFAFLYRSLNDSKNQNRGLSPSVPLGVSFRYRLPIARLISENGKIVGVEAGAERIVGDHYVVALGSYSRSLLQLAGLNIPIYPVKGYSLTIPISNAAAAPVSTIMDETYKVAITRFDTRIRVGGMAELSGLTLRAIPGGGKHWRG